MEKNKIFERENVRIDNEVKVFKITFKYSAYSLINSLIKTRLIPGGSTDETYKIVTFKACSVKSLEDYKNTNMKSRGKKNFLVSELANMVRTLCLQLDYLIKSESHTIIGYNLSDIIVINDEKFAFLGSELLANINVEDNDMTKKNQTMDSKPFKIEQDKEEGEESNAKTDMAQNA